MSVPSQSQRSWPIGLLALLVAAGILYTLMLLNASSQPAGGGEANIAAAFEARNPMQASALEERPILKLSSGLLARRSRSRWFSNRGGTWYL
jgi:hypothetical protein